MAIGVVGELALVGIVIGTVGVLLFGALGLMLAFVVFGVALISLDSELGDLRTGLGRAGVRPSRGWAPTCPGCGLDITGLEQVCPHCGRTIVRPPGAVP